MSTADLYTPAAIRRQITTARGALRAAEADVGQQSQECRDLRHTIARLEDSLAASQPPKSPRSERDAVEARARKRYGL